MASLTLALAAAAAAAAAAEAHDDATLSVSEYAPESDAAAAADDDDESSLYISDDEEGGGSGAARPPVAAKAGGATAAGAKKRKAQNKKQQKRKTKAAGGGGVKQLCGPSDFRGVILQDGWWHARLFYRGTTHIGRFDTEKEAAKAYDAEAKRVWLNPVLNFLPDGSRNPQRHSKAMSKKMVVRPGMEKPPPKKKAATERRKSFYRGLVWDRIKWRVQLKHNNKLVTVGRFDSEEEAARAYDAKAKELWANPVLNFLPDGALNPDRQKHVQACTYVKKDGTGWKNQPRRLLPPEARSRRQPAGPLVDEAMPDAPPPPPPLPPPLPLPLLALPLGAPDASSTPPSPDHPGAGGGGGASEGAVAAAVAVAVAEEVQL